MLKIRYNNINNQFIYSDIMTTLAKFDELVGETHVNAMRLHLDSMILCKNGSFSSAHQLAVEASQEICKTLVLENLLSQSLAKGGNAQDAGINRALVETFTSQRTLHRQVHKTIRSLAKQPEYTELALLLSKVAAGADDEQREKLTYVGLTKKDRKIDLDGKKVIPRLVGRKDRTRRQITVNNDFLAVYTSGYLSETYLVASDALAWELSKDNLDILLLEWTQTGRKAKQILARHQKIQTAASSRDTETTDPDFAIDGVVALESHAFAVKS